MTGGFRCITVHFVAESLYLFANSRFPLFIHRFVQLFEVEVHIGCEVVAFCEKGAAYEENGVRPVDLHHFFKELPFHSATGNREDGAESAHFCFRTVADFSAYFFGEREASAEAGEYGGISTCQAAELAVATERGDAGVRSEDERAGETGVEKDGEMEVRGGGEFSDYRESQKSRGCHDAAGAQFLCCHGALKKFHAVCGTVGDVEGVSSRFCIGVIHTVYAGLYSVFERSVGLVEKAVVGFDKPPRASL